MFWNSIWFGHNCWFLPWYAYSIPFSRQSIASTGIIVYDILYYSQMHLSAVTKGNTTYRNWDDTMQTKIIAWIRLLNTIILPTTEILQTSMCFASNRNYSRLFRTISTKDRSSDRPTEQPNGDRAKWCTCVRARETDRIWESLKRFV